MQWKQGNLRNRNLTVCRQQFCKSWDSLPMWNNFGDHGIAECYFFHVVRDIPAEPSLPYILCKATVSKEQLINLKRRWICEVCPTGCFNCSYLFVYLLTLYAHRWGPQDYLIFATMSSIPISMQASDDFSYKFPLESVFLNKSMELEK